MQYIDKILEANERYRTDPQELEAAIRAINTTHGQQTYEEIRKAFLTGNITQLTNILHTRTGIEILIALNDPPQALRLLNLVELLEDCPNSKFKTHPLTDKFLNLQNLATLLFEQIKAAILAGDYDRCKQLIHDNQYNPKTLEMALNHEPNERNSYPLTHLARLNSKDKIYDLLIKSGAKLQHEFFHRIMEAIYEKNKEQFNHILIEFKSHLKKILYGYPYQYHMNTL